MMRSDPRMKNKDKPIHVQDPRYKKRMQRKGLTTKPQDTDYPFVKDDPDKDDRMRRVADMIETNYGKKVTVYP